MWFKNARIYKVDLDENLKSIFNNPTLLEDCIKKARFKPLSATDMTSAGFSPVLGRHTEAFSFSFEHNHFFKFTEETKLLPKSVINQVFLDEIDNKEQELQRPLTKPEKQALKTALTQKMTAQAFPSKKDMIVMVNTKHNFVVVGATSAKRAEAACSHFRQALGSFPAKPYQPRCVVEERLTSFVTQAGELPQGFTLGFDTVLKSNTDEGGTVRISKEELTTKEVTNHIVAGKVITDLQLNYDNSVSFVLSQDLTIKRIALDDQYLERNLPQKTDDAAADLQGFLIVQAEVLTRLVGAITQAFDCD